MFDEPNLVSHAGLVPAMGLAVRAGLLDLTDHHLTVPAGAGHAAGLKVSALVAGMVAGADSISDMALLRHGAMSRLFTGVQAPSTLGTFLRAFRDPVAEGSTNSARARPGWSPTPWPPPAAA